jgi:hypothetical protein
MARPLNMAQHESEGTHVFALPCWRVRPGLPLSNFLDRRALVRGYAEVALVQTAVQRNRLIVLARTDDTLSSHYGPNVWMRKHLAHETREWAGLGPPAQPLDQLCPQLLRTQPSKHISTVRTAGRPKQQSTPTTHTHTHLQSTSKRAYACSTLNSSDAFLTYSLRFTTKSSATPSSSIA